MLNSPERKFKRLAQASLIRVNGRAQPVSGKRTGQNALSESRRHLTPCSASLRRPLFVLPRLV